MSLANSLSLCVQGNYLVGHFGGSQASISRAWVVSTACEVPIMFLCGWLLRGKGLKGVMALGLAGTWMKVATLSMAGGLWQYYLGLCLHGCFYAGAAAGFNVYLDRHFHPSQRPGLQSLSLVFIQGLPNAVAGLLAGILWHCLSLRAVYLGAGGIATGAGLYGSYLAWRFYISGNQPHRPGVPQ
jgi:hypothetical protein